MVPPTFIDFFKINFVASIIDFKCSTWRPRKYDLYQLLGYAALNEIGYKRVSNKITVINLVQGFCYTCDITSWSTQSKNEYIDFIGKNNNTDEFPMNNLVVKHNYNKRKVDEDTNDPKLKARLARLKKQLS